MTFPMTQAQAIELEHHILKKVGCTDEQLAGHFVRRYNRLILAHPLILAGHKLLDEGEIIAKLHERTSDN